jgi:AcrR family transcriptional regulator
MSAPRTKEDVLSEFRRAALMRAARRVFGAHGYESATMEEIAREAEVAKGTIYLYYPSKQAIYEAAFTDCMAELEERTRQRVESAPTVKDAIAAFVGTRVEFFVERQDFFRMYLGEVSAQAATAPGRPLVAISPLKRQARILERVLAMAVRGGEIRAVDPSATALALFDMTRGLVARHVMGQERADVRRDVAFLMDLIWTGLTPARRKQNR